MVFVARPFTVTARHKTSTQQILTYLLDRFPNHPLRRFMEHLPSVIGVDDRYFAEPLEQVTARGTFESRHDRAYPEQVRMAVEAARGALHNAQLRPDEIDGIVTLAATGFGTPGFDGEVIDALKLRRDIHRTPITQLACAGGAQGILEARKTLASVPDGNVLVVLAERLSLVFQLGDIEEATRADLSPLIYPMLFGDSGAAVVVSGRQRVPGLRVDSAFEYLLPNSRDYYRLSVASDGYHFRSRKEAPGAVGQCMPALTKWLQTDKTWKPEHAIIHPGSKAIIKKVVQGLGCNEALADPSFENLRTRGNEGGPALFGVMARHFAAPPTHGDRGLAVGIGPGVSVNAFTTTWCEEPARPIA